MTRGNDEGVVKIKTQIETSEEWRSKADFECVADFSRVGGVFYRGFLSSSL